MELFDIFKHALMITVLVFEMMLLIDFIDMASKRRISGIVQVNKRRQYFLASFLGATPGCLGAFMNVSLYVHGMISFGAVVAGMIATSGDEAFVMLAKFPGTALLLFGLLFIMGILFGWISDKIIKVLGIVTCEACDDDQCEQCPPEVGAAAETRSLFNMINIVRNLKTLTLARFLFLTLIGLVLVLFLLGKIGPASWDWERFTFVILSFCSLYIILLASEHYLREHIWDHIVKTHLLRVFLWSFGALILVHWGMAFWNLDSFVREHMMWVLVIGALIGIIPESGPHLVFVMMFAEGLIPFSVLFTASFVQDGHGMLPMLSYSVKDSVLIKAFNLVFGLAVGSVLFAMGL